MTPPIQLKRIRSITFSISGETGPARVVEVPVNRTGGAVGVLKVGRDQRSHLPLTSESVSRMHSVIEVARDNTITIIDLGSGTKVDGEAVNKAEIRVGTLVEVGAVTLIILSLQLEPVPAPEAEVEAPKVEALRPQVPTSQQFQTPSPVIDREPEISFENAPLEVLLSHYVGEALGEVRGFARQTTARLVRLARRIELEERE